ncbi:hypothetical protein Tco_0952177 [Tanacetum coccineum]|uniref:Reverse transcriptase domain-containing protein n=1 Tax=Tanacetum coccineum TaxID=301880 RepID=A0ABQ5DX24_9ASTR
MSIQDMEDMKQQYLDEMKTLINEKDYRNRKIDIEIKINELKETFNGMSIEINKKKKLQQLEQVANLSTYPSQYFNSFCYDDDDDDEEECSIQIRDYYKNSPIAIAFDSPITDSLIMEDEHLDTIPEMESDKVIKSSVKDLVQTPSESKDLSNYVSKCDLPFCDNSPDFNNDSEIFSNPLFDSNDDVTSSDDESFYEENVPVENFKIYSNPLLEFDEEIFSGEINPLYNEVLEDLDLVLSRNENDHFNAESNLIESLLNKDTVITSPKIDFLLEEFAGELAPINPIPSGIAETNFDPKEDIRLIKKLLYDNSSPRPPKELNYENSIKSFSQSPIPVEDSDSLMEEIDTFLLQMTQYHRPDPGVLTTKVMDDISDTSTRELYGYVPNVLTTLPTLYQVFDTLLLFSSKNVDKVFNHGILIPKEEKSPPLLSHRGFEVFQLINDSESPMMIYEGDIPILDVPYLHLYPP